MPAPTSEQLTNLAKAQFQSFAIRLPIDWQPARGATAEKQYDQAFSESERLVTPKVGLFVSATNNKYHCDTADKLSADFGDFITQICIAIASAWSKWQSAATLSAVTVNAVVASGGKLSGPPLMPLILATAPSSTESLCKYSRAVATTVSDAWQQYQSSVQIPGLPLYPALAAFPGPMAPPTPNVPLPIVALAQVAAPLQKAALKAQMINNLGDPRALHHRELFDCIAHAVAQSFTQWQASTQITNLLATGPIPSFAPPFVPVGPVVMGTAVMAPGGLQ